MRTDEPSAALLLLSAKNNAKFFEFIDYAAVPTSVSVPIGPSVTNS